MAESSSVPPVGPPVSGWTEMDVRVDLIDPSPFHVRTVIDPKRLEQLAESMRVSGLRNRILLRPVNGRYQLIGGERRWRAAMLIGWTTIPARVREMPDEEARREFVGDNEQRDDTTLIEKAKSYKLMNDPPDNKTHGEIALWVGKPRSMITETIGLLDEPEEIQTWIGSGSLTLSHIQYLKRIPEELQRVQLAERVVKEGWPSCDES